MLTEAGEALTGATPARLRTFPAEQSPAVADGAADGVARESDTPVWDAEHRELRVANRSSSATRCPAPARSRSWRRFRRRAGRRQSTTPCRRTRSRTKKAGVSRHDQNLNANQRITLIRFGGDGSGERVLWELVNRGARSHPRGRPGRPPDPDYLRRRPARAECGTLARTQAKSKPSPGSISACRRFTVYQKGPSSEDVPEKALATPMARFLSPTGRDYYLAGGCQL